MEREALPGMTSDDLRARGDRDLAERLLGEAEIRKAVERFEKEMAEHGARRQLLATAMRLTPEMAPDVHATMEACRAALAIDSPVETYVYPAPVFNAAAVRPERGLLFVLLSSSLLEAFEPGELKFVVGHELGHHLFEHHRIPLAPLLGGAAPVGPELALQLFAWQRYAEISSDRAGLACCGGFDPAAHALFKLASGLRGGRIQIRIDRFVSQVGELREEAAREARADEPMRSDWFATHPFSPLRVRAAELFAASDLMVEGGLSRDELEAQVQDLMTLMDPSYLQERSEMAEAMRRLLFAGAVLIAMASGEPNRRSLKALEELLGPGSVPLTLDAERIEEDLAHRIARVKEAVPVLRRAQVIRDLCVIVRADGRAETAEVRRVLEIAEAIGVDRNVVTCTLRAEFHH
ncbi:MAG: M48 family metalloprotease [Betaproteobacteria bacterium]|nr:M48 family metalloprotease [Betaproteobacteria bacterium]